MSKRILLVGATGYAGKTLATYLLRHTDAIVILAGRSGAKLDQLMSNLRERDLSRRAELLELDAAAFNSATLPDFDLLANATAQGPHNAPLIRACLERRADWIDMQMTNELAKAPTELRADIEGSGCCFVIQAGFHPGMIAPLIRYAATEMDVMNSAIVGSVIRDKGGLPYTTGLEELVNSFGDYKSEVYDEGRWQTLKYSDYPTIEFEYGFGELPAYPMEMTELRRLPELMPELKRAGFFVAGFNWFADYLVTPLVMLGSRIAPHRSVAPLGRLLSWSTAKFGRAPFGAIVQVDADGVCNDVSVRFRLSMFHDSTYVLTAVPTLAMIRQMLKQEVQPGIHLMGLCCDPVQLLEDIGRTDVSISQRSAEADVGATPSS